jgi:dTDP-4-dehydrorhamnose 3,5-epimerase
MSDKPLSPEEIASEFRDKVTTQDYSPKPKIDGVEMIDLPHFVDDGGTFIEIARLTGGEQDWFHGTKAAQLSFSQMLPGVTKAFHMHYNQDEVWFIPPSSRMLIGLVDVRADSPTKGNQMRFVMGGGKAKAFRIPRGVAHGVRNIGDEAGSIIYMVSQQFSMDAPDERRLPWDLAGADFWEVSKE